MSKTDVHDVRIFTTPPHRILESRERFNKRVEGLIHDWLGKLQFDQKLDIINLAFISDDFGKLRLVIAHVFCHIKEA